MRDITVLGIDLAKNVFQLHGSNEQGEVVLVKRINSRSAFIRFMAKLPPCLVGMEACGSAHYWGRLFMGYGHQVKLMHPGYTKAYVQRNKHDAADAKACHEAVTRAAIKSVPIKTEEQQAILMLHKVRSSIVQQMTQLSNQIRGHLYEFGITIPQGKASLLRRMAELLASENETLPLLVRLMLRDWVSAYRALEKRVAEYNNQINEIAKQDEACQRLQTIPGVGPITATAFVSHLKGYRFKKGRQAAAHIGLTPKEHSSGSTRRLGRISKQGNRYLRCLLVHGARSVVLASKNKSDKQSLWLQRIVTQRGYNKAVVALANKNARRAWSILDSGGLYQENFSDSYTYKQAA